MTARQLPMPAFNLATAQLRAGHPEQALHTATALRTELARRGRVDRDLDLVSATALFRLNRSADADRVAAGLTGGPAGELANAAWFLRGLIADARGDASGLQAAIAHLTLAADPADMAELRARRFHDTRRWRYGLPTCDEDQLDYRGMARALALGARNSPPDASSRG